MSNSRAKGLKMAVENVVTGSCVQRTTQRYGILCEHNCTPVLKKIYYLSKKSDSPSFNLASVHSPVVWFDVLFSGAAFCLHLEGEDFMYNLMK